MNKIFSIYKKEFRDILYSPYLYIFLTTYTFITGFLLMYFINTYERNTIEEIFPNMTIIFFFFVPLITAKYFTSEKKNNTSVLIISTPTNLIDVVIGKFLAIYTACIIGLIINTIQILVLRLIGLISIRLVLSSFLGFALLLLVLTSLGLFASSLSDSFYFSIFFCFFIFIALYIVDFLGKYIPQILKPVYAFFCIYSDIFEFSAGSISLYSVVHYISLTAIILIITSKSLEERWYL